MSQLQMDFSGSAVLVTVMLWVVARRFSSDRPGVLVSLIQVRMWAVAEEMYLVGALSV